MSYRHEWNTSELERFDAACGRDGANLSEDQKDRFSTYYHNQPDRERMSFRAIVDLANEWKQDNGGGFRRSDRR